jgi:hypothetical protein
MAENHDVFDSTLTGDQMGRIAPWIRVPPSFDDRDPELAARFGAMREAWRRSSAPFGPPVGSPANLRLEEVARQKSVPTLCQRHCGRMGFSECRTGRAGAQIAC